jgi:hypothetical protein
MVENYEDTMFKHLAIITALLTIAAVPASAHLAVDHLKADLKSRFDEVKATPDLHKTLRATALSELRILESRYRAVVSSNHKVADNEELRKLGQDIRNFDAKLHRYKVESARLKPKTEKE